MALEALVRPTNPGLQLKRPLALWDEFKQHDIQSPYPHREVLRSLSLCTMVPSIPGETLMLTLSVPSRGLRG
jgi:hypothetical protein